MRYDHDHLVALYGGMVDFAVCHFGPQLLRSVGEGDLAAGLAAADIYDRSSVGAATRAAEAQLRAQMQAVSVLSSAPTPVASYEDLQTALAAMDPVRELVARFTEDMGMNEAQLRHGQFEPAVRRAQHALVRMCRQSARLCHGRTGHLARLTAAVMPWEDANDLLEGLDDDVAERAVRLTESGACHYERYDYVAKMAAELSDEAVEAACTIVQVNGTWTTTVLDAALTMPLDEFRAVAHLVEAEMVRSRNHYGVPRPNPEVLLRNALKTVPDIGANAAELAARLIEGGLEPQVAATTARVAVASS